MRRHEIEFWLDRYKWPSENRGVKLDASMRPRFIHHGMTFYPPLSSGLKHDAAISTRCTRCTLLVMIRVRLWIYPPVLVQAQNATRRVRAALNVAMRLN